MVKNSASENWVFDVVGGKLGWMGECEHIDPKMFFSNQSKSCKKMNEEAEMPNSKIQQCTMRKL